LLRILVVTSECSFKISQDGKGRADICFVKPFNQFVRHLLRQIASEACLKVLKTRVGKVDRQRCSYVIMIIIDISD